VWTYTPTQAQRRGATASTTDTFTVTAGNGVNSLNKTVTVSVDAGIPVAGSATPGSPANATGAVSGSVSFSDPAGRTLSYSALATSTGGGAVSVNATTGAFTYTPTQAQRQAATGSTTDTFTITASNGVNNTAQLVTVPVSAKKAADTPFNSVVGTITVGSGGRGVAFSPDGTRAYVTNQFNNSVSVINTADNSVVTITGFKSPLGVAVFGTQAYVVNQGDMMWRTPASVTVISTVDNSVVATIALPSGVQPSQVAFSPDGSLAYVTDAQSSANGRVVVINTVDRSVSTIMGLGINPEAVAAFGSRLYVTNYYGTVGRSTGSVSVVDTSANNAVIADIVVGRSLPGRPGLSDKTIRVARPRPADP
jgi:YVTN family beta-propeller protein/VCBS repeat-containing protein